MPNEAIGSPGRPLLFEAYPALGGRLPWLSLGSLPTPVQRLGKLGEEMGLPHLYVKRDDLTSPQYGGNKVRKLEFLLADARRRRAQVVLTVGAAGSNHALATTVHARRLGMRAVLVLTDQPVSRHVRTNLLLDHRYGARLVAASPRAMALGIAWQRLRNARVIPPRLPYYIPPGGSSPLGCLGYVNAAFELKRQVDEGILPEPDCIFVAAGTLGTSAGLILGCRLAGLTSRVISVRACERRLANPHRMRRLIGRALASLRRACPDVPEVSIPPNEVSILEGYFGRQYGLFTEKGMEAISMMRSLEGIPLEGTYTGKALAAALDYGRRGEWRDRTILFWNTFNSVDLSAEADELDPHDLPRPFHRYFESPLQELDRPAGEPSGLTRPPVDG